MIFSPFIKIENRTSRNYKYGIIYFYLKCSCGFYFTREKREYSRIKNKICNVCRYEILNEERVRFSNEDVLNYFYKHNIQVIEKVGQKYSLICPKCNCKYLRTLKAFKLGTKICERCYNKGGYKLNLEEIKDKINSIGIQLLSKNYNNNRQKLELKCKCGNIFYKNLNKLLQGKQTECRDCSKKNNKFEKEILLILQKDLQIKNIKSYDRLILKPYELDFYLEDYKIAIECNGDFWHMNPNKFKSTDRNKVNNKLAKDIWDKDKNKKKLCKQKNLKLLTIWEDDLKDKEKIIKYLKKEILKC